MNIQSARSNPAPVIPQSTPRQNNLMKTVPLPTHTNMQISQQNQKVNQTFNHPTYSAHQNYANMYQNNAAMQYSQNPQQPSYGVNQKNYNMYPGSYGGGINSGYMPSGVSGGVDMSLGNAGGTGAPLPPFNPLAALSFF